MSSFVRRPLITLTTSAGGLLIALSSSAIAGADVWSIVDDSGAAIVSESGMPPFYQSVLEQGTFDLHHPLGGGLTQAFLPTGLLSTTNVLGMTNEDLVVDDNDIPNLPDHSVVDVANFGGGFENIYADLVGLGTGGSNEITDTLVTPFGNFDIPTTFDAAEFGTTTLPSAALESASSGFTTALEADWASLVALF